MTRPKWKLLTAILCLAVFCMQTASLNAQSKSEQRSETEKKSSRKSSERQADQSKSRDKSKSNSRGGNTDQRQGNRNIDPQRFDYTLMSQLVFELTNAERRRAGLTEFKNNKYLCAAATQHSQDMASREYFAHKSKGIFNRTAPRERIVTNGYNPSMTAENIAMLPTYNRQVIQSYPGYGSRVIDADFNTYNRLASSAVRQWMESPGHRRNILNGSLTNLGVGAAIGFKGNVPYVYLTQDFGG